MRHEISTSSSFAIERYASSTRNWAVEQNETAAESKFDGIQHPIAGTILLERGWKEQRRAILTICGVQADRRLLDPVSRFYPTTKMLKFSAKRHAQNAPCSVNISLPQQTSLSLKARMVYVERLLSSRKRHLWAMRMKQSAPNKRNHTSPYSPFYNTASR